VINLVNNWNFIDDVKPAKNGTYFVLWSNPYETKMTKSVAYFHNGNFINHVAGANEILYWMDIEFPETSKELRTRRVKRY
jgi:hypothetical protein